MPSPHKPAEQKPFFLSEQMRKILLGEQNAVRLEALWEMYMGEHAQDNCGDGRGEIIRVLADAYKNMAGKWVKRAGEQAKTEQWKPSGWLGKKKRLEDYRKAAQREYSEWKLKQSPDGVISTIEVAVFYLERAALWRRRADDLKGSPEGAVLIEGELTRAGAAEKKALYFEVEAEGDISEVDRYFGKRYGKDFAQGIQAFLKEKQAAAIKGKAYLRWAKGLQDGDYVLKDLERFHGEPKQDEYESADYRIRRIREPRWREATVAWVFREEGIKPGDKDFVPSLRVLLNEEGLQFETIDDIEAIARKVLRGTEVEQGTASDTPGAKSDTGESKPKKRGAPCLSGKERIVAEKIFRARKEGTSFDEIFSSFRVDIENAIREKEKKSITYEYDHEVLRGHMKRLFEAARNWVRAGK